MGWVGITLSTDVFWKAGQSVFANTCTSAAVQSTLSSSRAFWERWDLLVERLGASLWSLPGCGRGLSEGVRSELRHGSGASWQRPPEKSQRRNTLGLCCCWQGSWLGLSLPCQAEVCSGGLASCVGNCSLCLIGLCKNRIRETWCGFGVCWALSASEILTGFKLFILF